MAKSVIPVLILVLIMPVFSLAGEQLYVDSILAIVDINHITAENVAAEKKILKISGDSLLFPGQETELTNQQVFRELVVREIIFNQVTKMGFDTIPDEELQKIVGNFAEKFPGKDAYVKFLGSIEFSDTAVDDLGVKIVGWDQFKPIHMRFRTNVMVKRFSQKKVGLQVDLGLNSEFEEKGEELALKYPGKDQAALKEILKKEMFQQRLSDYIKDLSSRTDINVLDKNYKTVLKDLVNY